MNKLQIFSFGFDWWKSLFVVWLNALLVFFAPIAWVAILVGLATLADMGFGIWKTYKIKGKITSRKMRMGFVYKTLIYIIVVLFVFAIDKFIIGEILGMFTTVEHLATKIVAIILIGIEVYSMDESYEIATGKSFLTSFFKTVRNLHKAKDLVLNKDEEDKD